MKRRASGIDNAEGKQKIIVELYDKFFKTAFPKLTEKLGIVYTPVEVVDFIIHSVNDILQQEFGQTLGSKGVHIIDPFTGTGTFITRLLQSGLISPEELEHKYRNEIHANEIVLLAYYIAAINIEAEYHSLSGKAYEPFEGICLTDTFDMYEKDDLVSALLKENSNRRTRQKSSSLKVVLGNPPYYSSQDSIGDNNANMTYSYLDGRIRETYLNNTVQSSVKNIYDSYIRAIRWATDRISESGGVTAYVCGNAWLDRNFAAGMRRELAEDFSSIYILNLRGDIRQNIMKKSSREGENIFDSGSMTGICIAIFVKNPSKPQKCTIKYYDIGQNKSKHEKLSQIKGLNVSIMSSLFKELSPNSFFDWINQRDESYQNYIIIGDKSSKSEISLFDVYSLGINTNRDAWCYNFSSQKLLNNMSSTISFYNNEVIRYLNSDVNEPIEEFINNDKKIISWTSSLIPKLKKGKLVSLSKNKIITASYRPFCKTKLYYDEDFNHRRGQMPSIFPNGDENNRIICVTGVGSQRGFSVLMTDVVADIHYQQNGQCFPEKFFQNSSKLNSDLFTPFDGKESDFKISISKANGLEYFRSYYRKAEINEIDIFHYIYGLLHSEDYCSRFADNLSKELPRIPAVKKEADFWAFVEAGRKLGDLHVNYETVEPYPVTIKEGDLRLTNIADPKSFYRVEQMRFAGKRPNLDKTTVIYNPNITMTDIPLEAYDYVVNGKSALDWVMERQCVKTDKASGIVNDANDYANETMNDPAYPLKLFQRVITVSLETMKIVRSLPKLEID